MKYGILTLFLCFTMLVNAQTELYHQGNNLVGLSARGSFSSADVNSYGVIQFRYGRFVKHRINLGLDVGYSKLGQFTNAVEFGPFLRYYILNKSFTPLAEINYNRGQFTRNSSSNFANVNNYNRTAIAGGLAYSGESVGSIGFEALVEMYFFGGLGINSPANGQLSYVGRITYLF